MRLPSLPPRPHQKRIRKRVRVSKKLQLPPRLMINNKTTQIVVLGAVNTIPLQLADHSWKSCSKLKEHNKKAKEEKASVATNEVALPASVNPSLCTFDTGCTTHMTLDLIENYVGKADGTVEGV
jgi:hypothetical protein